MLRRVYFLPLDIADRLLGRSDEMFPPKSQIFVGSVDGFRRTGQLLANHLVDFGGLEPDQRVLEVGCGIGRLAVPLTSYLNERGSFEGLDIVESGITWCNEAIASKYPNFHFVLADVFNEEYNPTGHFKASEYRFPYGDGTFDWVILISVFTHMLPTDMEHYVTESERVLKPGGQLFATYFLINDESRRLMESGQGSNRFKYNRGSHWVVNEKVPELSVGYDEQYVRDFYKTYGLFAEMTIYHGGWCGRAPFWSPEPGLGDQDVVLATKR